MGLVTACNPTDPSHSRIDLRVLVVDDGSEMVGAISHQLQVEGVPYTRVALGDAGRPVITDSFLSSGSEAFFQAVVLPNENGGTLAPTELQALHSFESAFDIRQVDAYTYANPNVGLDGTVPNFFGDLNGVTATVTADGKADGFGYLNGPVPFDIGSYADVAPPLPAASMPLGASFRTLVSAPIPANGTTGSILGVYRNGGFDQLVITAAFNQDLAQFRSLAHGIVSWATRGVHLGYNRNYFSVQVDDVFNSDNTWDVAHNCTPDEDCPRDANGNSIYPPIVVRMTAADVDALVAWQKAHDFSIQMVFNGGVASDTDPLTQEFLANKDQFWWVNHTWTHEFLGCQQDFTVIPWKCKTDPVTSQMLWEPESLTTSQIEQNIAWAQSKGLPFDPTELVSGEYSGLQIPGVQPTDNPNFVAGLLATGMHWIAADVSRGEVNPRVVGGATTVPRYPTSIYYNAATVQQEVSEYNWLYTSVADGGSGYCTTHPQTTTCISPLDLATGFTSYIIPLETSLRMHDILGNDPRLAMVHATNLAGDRIVYPMLESVLTAYRNLVTPATPIQTVTLSQAGQMLEQQSAWNATWSTTPGSPSAVSAYLLEGQVHVSGSTGGPVPITVPAGTTVVGGGSFGQAYGGEQSAWVTLPSGGLTLAIPAGTLANPTLPASPTGVAVAAGPGTGTVTVSWTAPADGGRQVEVYLVTGGSPEAPVVATGTSTSVKVSGLSPGTSYSFAVRAASSVGLGPTSPTVGPVTPP